MLSELADRLRLSLGILHKQDIQTASAMLGSWVAGGSAASSSILLGDDCAAIADGDGYLLLAAEGLLPLLVDSEPWFAGWCSVLVNVSDIYAMGGRPIAVVDALWSESAIAAQPLWEGMKAAARTFNVPIVGGHTNCHSPYNALSVAILGRAQQLITSFNAQPGDVILMVGNFQGRAHAKYPFWDAATHADPAKLRADLDLLPQLAEAGLCDTGKDISMGGILGTLLMLMETSGCGACIDLDRVPYPDTVSLERWLICFPSYGFLLSVRPDQVPDVRSRFQERNLVCEAIGEIQPTHQLMLTWQHESVVFWDVLKRPLTGFTAAIATNCSI